MQAKLKRYPIDQCDRELNENDGFTQTNIFVLNINRIENI